jgi:predicted TIM-barrel fold metal-dependent hydrolase
VREIAVTASKDSLMIDVHIHVVNPMLPGDKDMDPLLDGAPDVLAETVRRQMKAAGVTVALGMGRWDAPEDDPLGINGTVRLATLVPGLHAIGIADPTRGGAEHFRRVEAALKSGKVRALKAYLGYVHHGPDSPGYTRYYELAAKYKLPFIFHTGDTYSTRAKLRFAHPLLVDDVAVDHPDVRFVLAHFGNPWLIDAAEVVYKNPNVWADLSALVVGDEADFHDEAHRAALNDVAESVRRAYRFVGRPDRFLFGSDWPLAPMAAYRDFIRSIVPKEHHEAVFERNAQALFGVP